MATRIIMGVSDTKEAGVSAQRLVEESFDRVMDLIMPLEQPSSALQAREALTLHAEGGDRIYVRPEAVVLIEENAEEDED